MNVIGILRSIKIKIFLLYTCILCKVGIRLNYENNFGNMEMFVMFKRRKLIIRITALVLCILMVVGVFSVLVSVF